MRGTVLILVAIVSVVLPCGASVAIEYFPTDSGAAFNYTYGTVTIVSTRPDEVSRVECLGCEYTHSTSYLIDAGGDVYATTYGSTSQWGVDFDSNTYAPSQLYLDFPLDAGKTWTGTSVVYSFWGSTPVETVTLTGRVVGPKTVTVPAGVFEVIEIELTYQYEVEFWRSGTSALWLHRQLGPVNGLEAWSGFTPTDTQSWGAVKADYR